MKPFLVHLASIVAIGTAFQLAVQIHPVGWRTIATIGACYLLGVLYIPRYPRTAALREVLKLEPGQKVEAEGK